MSEEVFLTIGGRRFTSWETVELVRTIDAPPTFTFTAPFEPERDEFRAAFRPLAFDPILFDIGSTRIVTGTVVGMDPDPTDVNARKISASGYGRVGVLADCSLPPTAYPLEFSGLQLDAIATEVVRAFGIGVVVQPGLDLGAPFEKVQLTAEDKPWPWLSDLARQRGIVLGETEFGDVLLLTSVSAGSAVATFTEGRAPFTAIKPTFNPQGYSSEISAIQSSKSGSAGSGFTVANPFLSDVVRPQIITVDDSQAGDVPGAARTALARMIGTLVTYTISDLPGWRTPSGALWSPNTTIKVSSSSAMIYRQTELLIRSVTLTKTPDVESASLELCLPGAFSDEIPSHLPWN